MPTRWERELGRLEDVDAPTARIRERAAEGPTSAGREPERSGRQRVVAGVVAFAVFAAAGVFAWQAFRPMGSEQLGPAPAAGPLPSGQGLIAFTASEPQEDPDGPFVSTSTTSGPNPPTQIYLATPDGSALRQLTHDPSMKGSLAWSPDGAVLAFTTFDLHGMHEHLSIMRSDGSGRRDLCKDCTGTFWVAPPDQECFEGCGSPVAPFADRLTWSPDGRWLAAPRSPDGGLALIEVSSGDTLRVDHLGEISGTSWSPDSASVAVGVAGDDPGLFVVDVDEGKATRLVEADPYLGSPPAWAPDGSTIAFGEAAKVGHDLHAELVMVNPQDGSSRTVLGTDVLFEIYDLQWSPDGTQLAVLHHPVDPPTAGLLTLSADGSDAEMVALCENDEDQDHLCSSNGGGVAWSPDGRQLAFRNYDGEGFALSVLTLGDEAQPVSGDLVQECCFAWGPSSPPKGA